MTAKIEKTDDEKRQELDSVLAEELQEREVEVKHTERALRLALAEARIQLDEIEKEYIAARTGAPYRRPGRVAHLDGGTVFAAFSAVELLLSWQRMTAEFHESDR